MHSYEHGVHKNGEILCSEKLQSNFRSRYSWTPFVGWGDPFPAPLRTCEGAHHVSVPWTRIHSYKTIALLKVMCMPILLYGLEACPLTRSQLSSLDFVVVRCAMKIFRTINRQVVLECLNFFGLSLPSGVIANRTAKLKVKLLHTNNTFIRRCLL